MGDPHSDTRFEAPVVAAGNAGFPAATRLARSPAARLALNVSPLGILDLYAFPAARRAAL
jgi:hypothetical protein